MKLSKNEGQSTKDEGRRMKRTGTSVGRVKGEVW